MIDDEYKHPVIYSIVTERFVNLQLTYPRLSKGFAFAPSGNVHHGWQRFSASDCLSRMRP